MTKGRVLIAMSGGLDSSIAALLLKQQGYDIIGITMKVWDYENSGVTAPESGCCNLDAINDARNIAVKIGFPHYVIDFREPFNHIVINDFINEYKLGRTPNPCVLCNTHIKWDALLQKADELDCQYIATGHYAQIRYENDRYILSKGVDKSKDQSYMLWGLSQESLARTLFPLGSFEKSEIRKMATEAGFSKVADKRESYDICFIPDGDYRAFLKNKIENYDDSFPSGDFVDVNGKILGKHKGYPFYTVGQRKGLEIALGIPAYVKYIDVERNRIVIAYKDELLSTKMVVKKYNTILYSDIPNGMDALVKIRYRDKGTMAKIYPMKDYLEVVFNTPVSAIAPGQSAVAYVHNDVLFGGFIDSSYDE